MKYYWLYPEDERHVNWVLYRADPNLTLRERYKPLACPTCGRVNEERALDLGLDADVRIRSKLDFLASDDGFICVSRRGRQIIERNGVKGLRYVPCPDQDFFIVWPLHRVHVSRDLIETREEQVLDFDAIARDPQAISSARKSISIEVDACGVEFHGKCETCGRYFYTLYWPQLRSMRLPDDKFQIVTPDLPFEKPCARHTRLLSSEKVVRTLQGAGLRGLEALEAT